MRVGFHPVADNPIRIAYVPGWASVRNLIQRVEELERKVDGGKVIPAPWEPFYRECPCCRDARAFAWARSRLQNPSDFAVDLAFVPADNEETATPIGRANWLMLCAEGEQSNITGKFMLAEALDLWEIHETRWLEQVVGIGAGLGIDTSVDLLRPNVRRALHYLEHPVPDEVHTNLFSNADISSRASHGFDTGLLQKDGWTQDPGTVVLPVDGKPYSIVTEMLLLNLHKIALLRGRKLVRLVGWEQVTLVSIYEGALTFDISGEPPLIIAGYKHPETVLRTVQECYRAATERILQALATQVIRTTP